MRLLGRSQPDERVILRVRRMKGARDEDVAATLGEAPD